MPKEKQDYVVHSASKALNLLKVFTNSSPELNLVEISGQINLNPSSTYRLLVTLEENGYVERDPNNGRYRLGWACLQLASAFQTQNDLRKIALPTMQRLRDTFKETIHLARLVGDEVFYLEKLVALLPIGIIGVPPGGRAPAYCTALGKVMLAYQSREEVMRLYEKTSLIKYTAFTINTLDRLIQELADIRRLGYAFDNEEINLGVKCIAVPIHNHSQNKIAAMSISGPRERIEVLIKTGEVIEALITASRQISDHLAVSEVS